MDGLIVVEIPLLIGKLREEDLSRGSL
jgi:hypothetical protein